MAETIDRTLWYKIRYTPIRDALRGRMTARLDLRRPLEESALPPEIQQLLRRVVRTTRLWRLEQLEVLQELIAHFKDGIASGASTDELIKAFGDVQQTAQLIRRAKRRNRPLPWHALRFVSWSMAALFVLYGAYAIYFFSGHPSPRTNYVDQINATVERTPVEDRAWTYYRRALIGTELDGSQTLSIQRLMDITKEDRRADLSEFVRTHQSQIAWIHMGSTKSRLGWLIGANGSVNDPELWPNHRGTSIDEADEPLNMASLPPLSGLRYLATMLRADALVAGRMGDGKRLLQDMESSLNLSRQLGDRAPLLLSLISIAISEMAMEDMEYALREHPALINREDWLALSRRLSAPKVAADLFSIEQERMSYDDMLQRAFTDDGADNGRLTAEGVVLFGRFENPQAMIRWWQKAAQPLACLFVPSRRQLKEEYTHVLDLAETNLKVALRDADWHGARDTQSWNCFPFYLAIPAYSRSQAAAEHLLGHRDGVVTGIALELYHQKHGTYPESLNALVPELLPGVPADRITGEPIHYRIVAGQPLLYSVGADRTDDGGRDSLDPHRPGHWDPNANEIQKGDWVLYPTIPAQ